MIRFHMNIINLYFHCNLLWYVQRIIIIAFFLFLSLTISIDWSKFIVNWHTSCIFRNDIILLAVECQFYHQYRINCLWNNQTSNKRYSQKMPTKVWVLWENHSFVLLCKWIDRMMLWYGAAKWNYEVFVCIPYFFIRTHSIEQTLLNELTYFTKKALIYVAVDFLLQLIAASDRAGEIVWTFKVINCYSTGSVEMCSAYTANKILLRLMFSIYCALWIFI